MGDLLTQINLGRERREGWGRGERRKVREERRGERGEERENRLKEEERGRVTKLVTFLSE